MRPALRHRDVLVLTGGWGPERSENLAGAEEIGERLAAAGCAADIVDIGSPGALTAIRERRWRSAVLAHTEEMWSVVPLNRLGIPHSGPTEARALRTYDKLLTQRVASAIGVSVPPLLSYSDAILEVEAGRAIVAKPRREGDLRSACAGSTT